MDRLLEETRSLAMKELEGIVSKGSLNQERLCSIEKLVDIIKDIHKMDDDEYSEMRGGYSMRRGYSRMYDDNSRMDGSHYGYSNGRYSRDDGRDSVISHLEELMRNATNEQDRESIRRTITQMER